MHQYLVMYLLMLCQLVYAGYSTNGDKGGNTSSHPPHCIPFNPDIIHFSVMSSLMNLLLSSVSVLFQ